MGDLLFAGSLFAAFVMLAGAFFYGIVKLFWGPKAARWASALVVALLLALGAAVGWWIGEVG